MRLDDGDPIGKGGRTDLLNGGIGARQVERDGTDGATLVCAPSLKDLGRLFLPRCLLASMGLNGFNLTRLSRIPWTTARPYWWNDPSKRQPMRSARMDLHIEKYLRP